jgi:hypothetical protein
MQTEIKYIFISIFFLLLQATSCALPVFDLDIQETTINGPVSTITCYRNDMITFDGIKWRVDDTRILTKTRFELNGQIADEWDFNNYEEANGQLVWEYKNGLIDTRSYSINNKFISMVRYIYSDNGKTDEELKFASNGAAIGNSKYLYNTDGKLTSITERDNAGTTTKQINYTYTKSGTISSEETLWYGSDSARLIRLFDKNEHIYEANGYKAEKLIYRCYYRSDSSGIITATSRYFDGDIIRSDISYTYDIYGNWTRKTVKIYVTHNGYTIPGESYMDSRSISYRIFAAYPTG